MKTAVFDKTDKGREEIATRKHQLVPRLRTLLVVIDGKQNAADLLRQVAGLGLNEQSLGELLDNGFIRATSHAPAKESAMAREEAHVDAQETAPQNNLPDEPNQFQAIYRFYTETIKSTIGLRGYVLQLKVEKAASVEDFRALRQPYLEAVLKAKGNEMARSLRDRLDQLLCAGTEKTTSSPD